MWQVVGWSRLLSSYQQELTHLDATRHTITVPKPVSFSGFIRQKESLPIFEVATNVEIDKTPKGLDMI